MTSYIIQNKVTKEFLEKTDAWGYAFTANLHRARVYTTKTAANRTMTNRPAYYKYELPEFELKEIKITLL